MIDKSAAFIASDNAHAGHDLCEVEGSKSKIDTHTHTPPTPPVWQTSCLRGRRFSRVGMTHIITASIGARHLLKIAHRRSDLRCLKARPGRACPVGRRPMQDETPQHGRRGSRSIRVGTLSPERRGCAHKRFWSVRRSRGRFGVGTHPGLGPSDRAAPSRVHICRQSSEFFSTIEGCLWP